MARYVQLTGSGLLFPEPPRVTTAIAFTNATIAATGDKIAMCGRVWFNERTGTKAIRRVGFRFSSLTKSGGSAMTVSLQDVDLSNGPVIRPDGVQDQTVAIANADAGFASSVWYRTNAFSADRTVTFGDMLAVVIEFDGAGRLGSDSIPIGSLLASTGATSYNNQGAVVTSIGGTWAAVTAVPNLVLEFTDGTFGTLEGSLPCSVVNTHSIASNTAGADEYACPFQVPFNCKVDGLWANVGAGSTGDFNMILYSGTTALQTVAVDANALAVTTSARNVFVPIPETVITKNTTYYASVQPSTTNAVALASIDLNSASHLNVWPGGSNATHTSRVDAGAWATATTTRRFMAGVRISSIEIPGQLFVPNLAGT